jgi:hypothetical protein
MRSVITGALNAITADRSPTRLKPIKSIKMLGAGKTNRATKWIITIPADIHFKMVYCCSLCMVNNKIATED